MRTVGFVQGVAVALTAAALLLVLSTCGGGHKQPSVFSYQSHLRQGYGGQASDNSGPPAAANPANGPAPLRLDDALAELAGMDCPEGVEAALFAQLKDALGEALTARAKTITGGAGVSPVMVEDGGRDARPTTNLPALQKIVSTPPTNEANRVADLAFGDDGEGNLVLTWHYRNSGDYDQNGVVGISDITPVAVHFGETYAPADANCAPAVIDGSGNGAVDIADITPLAVNFGVECAGYAVEDAAGAEGEFAEVARVPLPEAENGGRLLLSVLHALEAERPFVRVVPYDGEGNGGIPSEPLEIAGEKPHIGTGTVYPRFGVAGSEVTFTAGANGATPLYYSWDFGGGAEPNASEEPGPTVTLAAAGDYNAQLTLRNIFGTDECPFLLRTGVPPEVVEATPTEGDYSSEVAFSVVATGTEPLTYSWDFGGGAEPNESGEAAPTVVLGDMGDYAASVTVSSNFGTDTCEFNLHVLGWHIELVDDDGLVGQGASLALDDNGLPHVAYMRKPPGAVGYWLKYAYNDGTAWHVEVVDDEGDTGFNPSLALDSLDLPHISHYYLRDTAQDPTEDLNYAFYDGSSWQIETVDSEGRAGGSNSLAIDSQNRPHIAYGCTPPSEAKHLKYAWHDGAAWQIETVDGEDWVGDSCSLALDSLERPHIGYAAYTNNKLKYAYYDGAGWQLEMADSEPGTGHSITLALDSLDRPHISHQLMALDIRDIKYSYYDGLAWHNELLDFENRVLRPSLALDSADHPHIAFSDIDAYDLRYTYWDGAWRVKTIDASGCEEPSLALNTLDRPCVCYYVGVSDHTELRYAAYY